MRMLTILAVLLAPLGMLAAAPASARAQHEGAGAAAGHCDDRGESDRQSEDRQGRQHDCMMACAAIPSFGSELPAKLVAPTGADPARLSSLGSGLMPEAATPPPRSA